MPRIITNIHDPVALAATCRQLHLDAPRESILHGDPDDLAGWIVSLPGVCFPIVIDTLTGLVAYHSRDNHFRPYRRIMRFIQVYYLVNARLRHQAAQHEASDPADTEADLIAVEVGF